MEERQVVKFKSMDIFDAFKKLILLSEEEEIAFCFNDPDISHICVEFMQNGNVQMTLYSDIINGKFETIELLHEHDKVGYEIASKTYDVNEERNNDK